MAEENSSHPPILKGTEQKVLVEETLGDVIVVCLKDGSREFRGALLDSNLRNFPHTLCFGGIPSKPGGGGESCKSVDSVKGTPLENTTSSTCSRYTYHKDVIKLYEKPVEAHPKSRMRSIRSKTVRDIRLRPRQTLCVNCKCAIHENGKGLPARNHQTPSKHKSPSRNVPTRPTRRTSVTPIQPKPQIMDSPRMSLRKRSYNLLGDGPQPKVKLTRCDSAANLVQPGKRTSASHASGSSAARSGANDRNRNGCKTEGKQSKVDKTGRAVMNGKATPVIKITIGPGSVIKIPPKRSDADEHSDILESHPITQGSHLAGNSDTSVIQQIFHKKLKKSSKKTREKDKDAVDSDVVSSSQFQRRKRKRKHKHRHTSLSEPEIPRSPRGPSLAKDPISSSQDPEESFKENKSFRNNDNVGSTYEDESEDMDMEDTENSSPLREDYVHPPRPRLLYTISQNDGLIQIDSSKKEKKEYPLRSRSSQDSLHMRGVTDPNQVRMASVADAHPVRPLPNSPSIFSGQNSPCIGRSNQSSPQKSYHGSPLIRGSQDPLQVHNCQDSTNARGTPNSPYLWSNQDSVHNQSSQDSFMWNSPNGEDNEITQSHMEETSDGVSSEQSSDFDSDSESDNEASDSDGDNCDGPPNGNPPESPERHPQGNMIMKFMTVSECDVGEGRKVRVGDIVWGKIQGFPWWPGKVNSITMTLKDNDCVMSQSAHVLWFGSSTTSHMDCRSLLDFNDNFKDRFNKKKRGMYKTAIKQATAAADDRAFKFDIPQTDPEAASVEKTDFDAYDLLD